MQGYGMPTEQSRRRRKKRSRIKRFFRGYLMSVGALTTTYVLFRILIYLLVEITKIV